MRSGITQTIGFSGAGLSELARKVPGATYVSPNSEQHLSYLRDTVFEEIAFPLEQRGIAIPEIERRCLLAAEQLHITDLLEHDPSRLSGGQTRRVVIATALAQQPSRLVLDSPFAGLDVEASEALRQVLVQLSRSIDIHIFSYLPDFPDYPVEVVGEDPRDYVSPRIEPLPPAQGFAWRGTVTGTRGVEKRWWRSSRTDFTVGPVDIEVPKGGVLWLRGENGAGKTTLLRELAKDPACAWLTQNPLDQLIFSSISEMYPGGKDEHPYDLPASELRLAQLRMVTALGRPVLLLDEPEAGLDEPGRDLACAEIRKHLAGPNAGVVLVTHDEEFAGHIGEISSTIAINI